MSGSFQRGEEESAEDAEIELENSKKFLSPPAFSASSALLLPSALKILQVTE
jgi:hypothetical protein